MGTRDHAAVNRAPGLRAAKYALAALAVGLNAVATGAIAQGPVLTPGGDTTIIATSSITSDTQPTTFTIQRPLEPNVVGLTVQVRIRPMRSQILGLSIFTTRDGAAESQRCRTEGFGPIVQCRVIFTDSDRGPLLALVSLAGGKGAVDFSLRTISLRGPLVPSTTLAASDARLIELDRTIEDSIGTGNARGNAALYVVSFPATASDSAYVTLTQAEGQTLRVRIFEPQGTTVEMLAPVDAFTQSLITRDGARSLLLLVQSTDDYPGRKRFTLRVGRTPATIQALAPNGEATWSGHTEQQIKLRVPSGWSGIITLNGRGQRLHVTDSSGRALSIESAFGGTMLGVRVGDPWQRSAFVRTGVDAPTSLTIDVAADPTEPYHIGWELTVRGKRGSAASLVAFPSVAVEQWPSVWQSGRRMLNVADGVRAFMIPPPPDRFRVHGGSQKQAQSSPGAFRFGAHLVGDAKKYYDIAVTNELGEVIDIADETAYWEWPGDTARLAIVVFAQPGKTPPAAMPVQIEIQAPQSAR